jgi:arsenite methyltransferase
LTRSAAVFALGCSCRLEPRRIRAGDPAFHVRDLRTRQEGSIPDPFSNVDAASPEIVEMIAAGLETRAADPAMLPVIDAYLERLRVPDGGMIVDIGCGTGGVTRRIADRFSGVTVVGVEPSTALTATARTLAGERPNLSFRSGDGAALDLADGSADIAILHTVLSHVADPVPLIAEAVRILRPGGTLVICDADFSKATLGLAPGDPLGACAEAFVAGSVTDAWLTGKLRPLAARAGLAVEHFAIASRVVTEGMGNLIWVRMSVARLVEDGVIGQALAEALEAEYHRRAEAGTLYGFLPFVTLIARKPAA